MLKLQRKIFFLNYFNINVNNKNSLSTFKIFVHTEKNVIIQKNFENLLKFKDNVNTDIETVKKKYEVDNTFCSYITKRKKIFNLLSYNVKKYEENIFYKKSDGSENAFLYSNVIKPLKYCDRISDMLLINCFHNNSKTIIKKNLFDVLYKKCSLVYFFMDTKQINEMNKYLEDFEKNKKNFNIEHKINQDCFLKLKKKQKPIHIFYCYVSPYKFLLSNYFSKKISENLKSNYFDKKNFFFMNSKLSINDENALLLFRNNSLPSLLLFDEYCYIRYHIKGLFTNEASYYLFKVLLNI
ncbi:conserved Plasmodium protein, unknown function [Plasmodium gallinaceum]|uniref:Uncharacterized protein n=1 Tax=Plasmodium gallinaceum TaxID=5849 RepID=A0A1J1GWN6_PLAGA|nr:conserved Plasmodium protein, unknown function [Plasmodium gallinaceum]CRG96963.1 conserved Plasmodium protein, unknown function [Plasmodium gallinaceum]